MVGQLRRVEELVEAYESDDILATVVDADGVTNADRLRTALLRRLESDPNADLPRRWYSDRLGRILGLPVPEGIF